MTTPFRWIRLARHWHARAGVLAAVFFICLALSGIALNHTDSLDLDHWQVSAPWLMAWYGLKTDVPNTGYRFPGGYLAWQGGKWILNKHVLGKDLPDPIGASQLQNYIFIADTRHLSIYQSDGQQVDRLDASGLPASAIQAIGVSGNDIVLHTPRGDFSSPDGGINWHSQQKTTPVQWSHAVSLDPAQQKALRTLLAPSLPLERILLDLHSGRIIGRFGPYLMDAAALVLLLLSLSGVWIYWQSLRRP